MTDVTTQDIKAPITKHRRAYKGLEVWVEMEPYTRDDSSSWWRLTFTVETDPDYTIGGEDFIPLELPHDLKTDAGALNRMRSRIQKALVLWADENWFDIKSAVQEVKDMRRDKALHGITRGAQGREIRR